MLGDHDKLSTRLAYIIFKLNAGERLNLTKLAQDFGVSKRTIQRDLKRLSFLSMEYSKDEISLTSHTQGGIGFKNFEDFLKLCGLTNLFPNINEASLQGLLNPNLNASLSIHPANFEKIREKSEEFEQLQTAILTHQIIKFHYHQKERIIHPYKLIHHLGIWYLLGAEQGKIKSFAVKKIKNFDAQKQYFNPDPSLLQKFEKKKLTFPSECVSEIELFIDSYAMPYFEKRSIFPNQKIISKDESGMEILIQSSYDEEILRIIQQWMPHILIISPSSLQDTLKTRIEEYLKMYK